MDEILLENREGIAIVTLNRPERLNAIYPGMKPSLEDIIDAVRTMDDLRALVVTGAGRAFCAGYDAQALLSYSPKDTGQRSLHEDAPGPWLFAQLSVPTVAAINGAAVGLGAEILISCDVRIAGEAARAGWVFPHRGIVPDVGLGTWLLPKIVGLSRAARILFSGEIMDASTLLEMGLVEKVVPNQGLLEEAIDMAKRLSTGAPLAIREMKRLLYRGLERDFSQHSEDNAETLRRLFASEDFQEGVRSFLEKRSPVWTGR